MNWTENDIRFYTASANKAGAFSWMANQTKEMYEKRKFYLHLLGIGITTTASGWGIVVGIISKDQRFLAISMIVAAIITLIGTTLNNIDKLLNYDDEIQAYSIMMEANQLHYWDIYRTIQSVLSGTLIDKNMFKGTMDERAAQLVKKYKPFPEKIVEAYYKKFGDQAIDYNVLFNDKIDPNILETCVEFFEEQNAMNLERLEKLTRRGRMRKQIPPARMSSSEPMPESSLDPSRESSPEPTPKDTPPLKSSGSVPMTFAEAHAGERTGERAGERPRNSHEKNQIEIDKINTSNVKFSETTLTPRLPFTFRPTMQKRSTILGQPKKKNLTAKQKYELDRYVCNFEEFSE